MTGHFVIDDENPDPDGRPTYRDCVDPNCPYVCNHFWDEAPDLELLDEDEL